MREWLHQYGETIFLVVSGMELFMGVLGICNVTLPMSRYLLWIFLMIYAVIALDGKLTARDWIVLGVLMLVGVLLYWNSGLNTGIKAPVYLYALRNIDKRKYCKVTIGILLGTSAGLFLLSALGLFGTWKVDVEHRGIAGWRYCFGYPHPNRAMAVIFFAMLLFLYAYGERMKAIHYLMLAAGYSVGYIFTDSRTAYILGIAVLLLTFCVRKWNGSAWNPIVFALLGVTFISMMGISLMAAAHVDNERMRLIDRLITGRISMLSKVIDDSTEILPYMENWHLFGSRQNQAGYDMGYVQIFYYYGIVPACIYLGFCIYAAVRAWKSTMTVELIVLWGFSAYLFMENVYFSNFMPIHMMLIFAGMIVTGGKDAREKEKTVLADMDYLHVA